MNTTYYELVARSPGVVAWYCGLKLELAVALTKVLLIEQMRSAKVPGFVDAEAKLAEELRSRLGVDLDVDEIPDLAKFKHADYEYAPFERNARWRVCVHMDLGGRRRASRRPDRSAA